MDLGWDFAVKFSQYNQNLIRVIIRRIGFQKRNLNHHWRELAFRKYLNFRWKLYVIRNLEINYENQRILYQSCGQFIKEDEQINGFNFEQLWAAQSGLNQTYVLGATNLRFNNHSYEDKEKNKFWFFQVVIHCLRRHWY